MGSPAVTYLDDSGNPQVKPKVYLDDSGNPAQTEAPVKQKGLLQKAGDYFTPVTDALQGVGAGALKTANSLGAIPLKAVSAISKVTGGEGLPASYTDMGAESSDVTKPPDSLAGKGGNLIENIAEFAMGEGELKTLQGAAKMKKMASVMSFMEEHPTIAKMLGTAIRQGTVGAAQGEVKGSEHPLAEGGIIGLTGGLLEGGSQLINGRVVGKAQEAAGAENVARDAFKADQAKAAAAAQTARQTATAAADSATDKAIAKTANEEVKNTAAVRQELQRNKAMGTMAQNASDSAVTAAQKVIPGIKSFKGIKSFGDAADRVEGAAKTIYSKLDDLSGGEFNTLQNDIKRQTRLLRSATTDESAKEAEAALADSNDRITQIIEEHKDSLSPGDYHAAQSAWKDKSILSDLHTVVERSFTAPEDVAKRTVGSAIPVPRILQGGKMANRLNTLVAKRGQDEIERVIGKDGLDNLYQLSEVSKTPRVAKQLSDLTSATAERLDNKASILEAKNAEMQGKQFSMPEEQSAGAGKTLAKAIGRKSLAGAVGGLVGHYSGAGAAQGTAAGVALDSLSQYVIEKASTNPRIGKMLLDATKSGVSSRIAAPLIAAEIRKLDAK